MFLSVLVRFCPLMAVSFSVCQFLSGFVWFSWFLSVSFCSSPILSVSLPFCLFYVCLSLFVFVYVCFCPFLSASVRLCLFMSIYVCFCSFVSIYFCFCLWLSMFFHLFWFLSFFYSRFCAFFKSDFGIFATIRTHWGIQCLLYVVLDWTIPVFSNKHENFRKLFLPRFS